MSFNYSGAKKGIDHGLLCKFQDERSWCYICIWKGVFLCLLPPSFYLECMYIHLLLSSQISRNLCILLMNK